MKKQKRHNSLNREYRFLKVKDVMELLDIGQTKAYNIIRGLNKEIEAAGFYDPVRGRVSETYFKERFYLGDPKPTPSRPATQPKRSSKAASA